MYVIFVCCIFLIKQRFVPNSGRRSRRNVCYSRPKSRRRNQRLFYHVIYAKKNNFCKRNDFVKKVMQFLIIKIISRRRGLKSGKGYIMAKLTAFLKSQKAHLVLRDKYLNAGTTPKNLCYGNYHSDCFERQRNCGKLLTKQEKRSIFQFWQKYEIKGKATKFHLNEE